MWKSGPFAAEQIDRALDQVTDLDAVITSVDLLRPTSIYHQGVARNWTNMIKL